MKSFINILNYLIFLISFYLIIISIFFLCSCAAPDKTPHYIGFEKYVKQFEDYSVQYARKPIKVESIDINFDDLPKPYIGFCYHRYPRSEITIDRSWWNRTYISEADKEMLLAHELSHCILLRIHNNELFPNGNPKSLMIATTFPDYIYIDNKEYYIRELFDNSIME